ncbi:MAG: N(G),N(G)-dimethylarginine dimethylaminohydrolase [Candidatus Eremiobacteraeota bacterium]|nr:N(G),N(G)-dimethylarginine dimethylaminohydrolase [Candidatus Eremiobacteraeota bacterium]
MARSAERCKSSRTTRGVLRGAARRGRSQHRHGIRCALPRCALRRGCGGADRRTRHARAAGTSGAPRRGASLRPALVGFFTDLAEIDPPGTLDGGDVCDAGDRVYVGLSHRTNASGIAQLGAWLERDAKRLIVIDIRNRPALLHLKSGMSFLGDGRFAAVEVVAPLIGTRGQDVIVVQPDEAYAANCVRVNGVVFVAAGFPNFNAALTRAGFLTVALEVSEFRKMDGGLSCLSLRF